MKELFSIASRPFCDEIVKNLIISNFQERATFNFSSPGNRGPEVEVQHKPISILPWAYMAHIFGKV